MGKQRDTSWIPSILGASTEPVKLTNDEQETLKEYEARKERIGKILSDFTDDSKKKIIEIIKVFDFIKLEEEYQFLIANLGDPQKIIEIVTAKVDKDNLEVETHPRKAKWVRAMARASALNANASLLKHLASLIDSLIDSYSDRRFAQPPQLAVFPGQETAQKKTPISPEGNEIRTLASELRKKAMSIHNSRPVLSDDDQTASPNNYFKMRRVRRFLPQLPDDNARHSYLQKLKAAFLRKGEEGFIYNYLGHKSFNADQDFNAEIESEIDVYQKILKPTIADPNRIDSHTKQERGKRKHTNITARQRIILLTVLTFGRLDLPDHLIKQRVVEVFQAIIDVDEKTLQVALPDPVKHKGTKRSIKRLLEDLDVVRRLLAQIEHSDNVQKAVREIDLLIDELDEEN